MSSLINKTFVPISMKDLYLSRGVYREANYYAPFLWMYGHRIFPKYVSSAKHILQTNV